MATRGKSQASLIQEEDVSFPLCTNASKTLDGIKPVVSQEMTSETVTSPAKRCHIGKQTVSSYNVDQLFAHVSDSIYA